MDELLYRMGSNAIGSGLDWIVAFSFVAFALVYFLAPVLGYDGSRRGLISASLYVLLGYGVVLLLQVIVSYLMFISRSNNNNNFGGPGTAPAHFNFLFSIVKIVVYLGAQGCFIFGLQSLRRDHVAR